MSSANALTRLRIRVARPAVQLLLPGLREPVKRLTLPVWGFTCVAPRIHSLG
jgi:hypothetical protein